MAMVSKGINNLLKIIRKLDLREKAIRNYIPVYTQNGHSGSDSIYTHIYICVYICIYTRTYTDVCVCTCVCVSATYICTSVYLIYEYVFSYA